MARGHFPRMARGRPPKRPPTPSDSEETSESENEEADLTLPVGAEAEVRSDDPGFVGSFYEVTVTGRRGRHYTVVYSTLVADEGGPLEETAAAADVRPRPPREGRREFAVHEAVEALHNGGWWAGVVTAVPPPVGAGAPMVYKVTFPTSRERMEFQEAALRPHRVFRAGCWLPAAEAKDRSPLFREGTQVEVSRSAKNFGESWSPASVLKVIGATNLLVKYAHIGEDREVATEIIDSQYIRPARDTCMDSKYRISRSCHVEVMHDGRWWPGVIREVLGSGSGDKYEVGLKIYETDMEDVECVDVLIVGITQMRLRFDWDGKQWIRHLSKEFVNGAKLTSKKRPSSSVMSLSLYKEVGEVGDKRGSYREKKLKNADVVSELASPLLSVCIDNDDIIHTSSSYADEAIIQGNAVAALGSHLAPVSLTSMAELAHLSDSSLAHSSHLEQASSQKMITPSALVHRDPHLQASLLGSFGQPRSLPQGSHLGMPSHNPQIPKERTSAKSIEEARNNVPISEDFASRKDGDYDGELGYNLTAGRGMVSEMNKGICVDPTLPPKDAGGPQHAVSQQGGGSAMDDRYSESPATEVLPFVKTSPMWTHIEAMDIFSKAPQRPHFNQLPQHCLELREGMALGLMLSFASLAETISRLGVENDIEGLFEEKMHGLSLMEESGFDVGALKSQLEALLCRKKRHHAKLHDDAMKTLKEKIACEENDDRELGMQMRVLAMAADHLELYARLMRAMMRSAVTQKMSNAMKISRLKAEANELERSRVSAAAPR